MDEIVGNHAPQVGSDAIVAARPGKRLEAAGNCKIDKCSQLAGRAGITGQTPEFFFKDRQSHRIDFGQHLGGLGITPAQRPQCLLESQRLQIGSAIGERCIKQPDQISLGIVGGIGLKTRVGFDFADPPALQQGGDEIGMIDEMPVKAASSNLEGVRDREHPDRVETAFCNDLVGRIKPVITIQARRLEFSGVSSSTGHGSRRLKCQGQQEHALDSTIH